MIYRYLYSFFALILFTKCANEVPPTGGPEDVEPPILLSTIPSAENNLNYNQNEVVFEFNEWIETNALKKNMVITPDPGKYTYTIKKKKLIIKFEENLKPNTTYKIAINNGVRDITKKNELSYIDMAFSTGDFLDSLEISGNVKMLMTDGKVGNALVAIYKKTDSLDIRKHKPDYFSFTENDGSFNMRYLKADEYDVFAYIDKNNNRFLDIKKEPFAYLSKPIDLKENIYDITFNLANHDTSSTSFVYAKPKGNYHQLVFDKGITAINYRDSFKNEIVEGGKTVYLYTDINKDSTQFIFNYVDSLKHEYLDTTYLIKPKKVNEERLVVGTSIKNLVKKANDSISLKVIFNEPIKKLIEDSIQFSLDTTELKSERYLLKWNENKTVLTISTFAKTIVDTIKFLIPDSTIFSIYGQTNDNIKLERLLNDNTEYGSITGKVTTNHTSYKIQLLDKNFQLVKEMPFGEMKTFEFEYLNPGDYNIRVLIDKNENKEYDKGNILERTAAEPIFIYPEAILIRKNWEITNIELRF